MRHLSSLALLAVAPAVWGQNGLSITNYSLVSQARYTRTQSYFTYRADLINPGAALAGVTATVTSLVPAVQVVAGQGTLHFAPVPANSRTTSADTFTLLVDTTVPFDFASLSWSFANPVANPGPNQTAAVGTTVVLNGSGSTNPAGAGPLTYAWTIVSRPVNSRAQLANSNSVIASFVVDAEGSYSISLTVSNGTGSDTALVTVSTANSPPVANAGPNQTVSLGATVVLNGSLSSDADGDPLTYSWSLVAKPAGSTAVISNVHVVSPTFVADQPGSYIAQLVVNDGTADSAPSTVTVTVAGGNTKPVANAGPNQTVAVGTTVQLNGAGSTDVDGDPLTYRWSLVTIPAGSLAALSNPRAVNPTFTADLPGTYVAQLIVNDGKIDSDPATVTITTSSTTQLPTANPGPNQTVAHGSIVTLSGSGTDPAGLPLNFTWSLLTKPAGSSAALSSSTGAVVTFVADKPGTYVAQLIASDGVQSSLPATVTITTTNTPPVANAGPSRSVPAGAIVALDGSGSFDADHDPLTYSWSLLSVPQGSAAVLQGAATASPSFFADLAGTYVAQLIVNDGYAASGPSTVTISAGSAAVTVTPNPLVLSSSPGTLSITTATPAPAGGIAFTVSSSNPGVVYLRSGSVFLSEGLSSIGFQVTPVAPGTAVIHVSAPGVPDATANVTVAAPGTITLSGPATVPLNGTAQLTVTLSTPAPADGLTVQLGSSGPLIAGLAAPVVVIPAGAASGTASVNAINVGAAAITASAAGYTPAAPLVINVTATVVWVTPSLTITGVGNTGMLNLQLTTHAPLDPNSGNPWSLSLPVNLSSSNPNVVQVQANGIFFWDGSSAPILKIQVGAVGVGTAVIHASGVNIPDVTATVTVVPSGAAAFQPARRGLSFDRSLDRPVLFGELGRGDMLAGFDPPGRRFALFIRPPHDERSDDAALP